MGFNWIKPLTLSILLSSYSEIPCAPSTHFLLLTSNRAKIIFQIHGAEFLCWSGWLFLAWLYLGCTVYACLSLSTSTSLLLCYSRLVLGSARARAWICIVSTRHTSKHSTRKCALHTQGIRNLYDFSVCEPYTPAFVQLDEFSQPIQCRYASCAVRLYTISPLPLARTAIWPTRECERDDPYHFPTDVDSMRCEKRKTRRGIKHAHIQGVVSAHAAHAAVCVCVMRAFACIGEWGKQSKYWMSYIHRATSQRTLNSQRRSRSVQAIKSRMRSHATVLVLVVGRNTYHLLGDRECRKHLADLYSIPKTLRFDRANHGNWMIFLQSMNVAANNADESYSLFSFLLSPLPLWLSLPPFASGVRSPLLHVRQSSLCILYRNVDIFVGLLYPLLRILD